MAESKISDEEREILQKLRDKHGAAKPFRVAGVFVVVRKATPGDLHRYKEKIGRAMAPKPQRRGRGDDVSLADAERELALSSIVWPEDRALVTTLLEGQPGFLGTAAGAAEDLASEQVEDLEGN